jgi:hypothetical protein
MAIRLLREDVLSELYYLNTCIHMEKVGIIEFQINQGQRILAQSQLDEVRQLAKIYAELDPVDFVQEMSQFSLGQKIPHRDAHHNAQHPRTSQNQDGNGSTVARPSESYLESPTASNLSGFFLPQKPRITESKSPAVF